MRSAAIFLVLILSAAAGAASEGVSAAPPVAERIPADLRENAALRVEQGDYVGVVVGLVDALGTTYFARGNTSRDGGQAVGESTIFEIGSITKVFTAIALADMAERGLVALDDPVSRHLPPPGKVPTRGDRQMTLRDLATHRSGLPRLPDGEPLEMENPYAHY